MSLLTRLRATADRLIAPMAAVTVKALASTTTSGRAVTPIYTSIDAHAVFTGRVRENVDGSWRWSNRTGALVSAEGGDVTIPDGSLLVAPDGTEYRLRNVRPVSPDGATTVVFKVECER